MKISKSLCRSAGLCALGMVLVSFGCESSDPGTQTDGPPPPSPDLGMAPVFPSSCEQVRAANPTFPDGVRMLFINGDKTKPWDAYCVMSVMPALTYLSLTNVGAGVNYSQYTASTTSPGTNTKTNYTKLRIDPATLKIDTNDKRFATSTGSLTHGSPL